MILFEWVFQWINRPMSQRDAARIHTDFQERLRTPKIHELERHFGLIPTDLKTLYADSNLIAKKNFYFAPLEAKSKRQFVRTFLPADVTTLKEYRVKAKQFFPFAQSVFGKLLAAEIDPLNAGRCAVFLIDDEYGQGEKVAESLVEFIRRPMSDGRPA